MKRLSLLILVFTIILSITAFSASADAKSLLPTDVSKWKQVDAGGESATAVIKDGATVVSGSVASWPNVTYTMTEDEYITVPIKGYAVEYDFSLDKGQTNIVVYFKGGVSFQFTNCIDTPNKDPGSGDIKTGSYKGVVSLEDMMKSENFPANVANSDDTITFAGITIYSVAGATVTVKKFQLIEANQSSTGSESSASSESKPGTSSAVSATSSIESKSNSSSASSSEKPTSSVSSMYGETTQVIDVEPPSSTWYYIIGGAAVVAIVVIVVVIVSKKKK